jgi:adenylate kinase
VDRISGAPILCNLAGVKSLDELRRLPEEKRGKLRPRLYEIILAMMTERPDTFWLFDGHFCYFDWEGKKFGVRPIQAWDKELMLGIVVLESKPETILARRKKDNRLDRKRDLAFIRKEMKKEAEIARLQAESLHKPLKFLNNNDGEEEKNAETILRLIGEWKEKL